MKHLVDQMLIQVWIKYIAISGVMGSFLQVEMLTSFSTMQLILELLIDKFVRLKFVLQG